MKRAHVISVDALRRFKAHLRQFGEEIDGAIIDADAEVARSAHWLEHQQLPYWMAEIRRRAEQLTRAKGDLLRAESQKAIGKPSTVDERKAVERAKRSLEEARRKAELCRKWVRQFAQEVSLYRGGVQRLRSLADATIPAAAARIDRYVLSLERYLAAPAPTGQTARGEAAGAGEPAPSLAPEESDWVRLRRRADECSSGAAAATGEADIGAFLLELEPAALVAVEHACEGAELRAAEAVFIEQHLEHPVFLTRTGPDGANWYLGSWAEPRRRPRVRRYPVDDPALSRLVDLEQVPAGWCLVIDRGRLAALYDAQGRTLPTGGSEPRSEDAP